MVRAPTPPRFDSKTNSFRGKPASNETPLGAVTTIRSNGTDLDNRAILNFRGGFKAFVGEEQITLDTQVRVKRLGVAQPVVPLGATRPTRGHLNLSRVFRVADDPINDALLIDVDINRRVHLDVGPLAGQPYLWGEGGSGQMGGLGGFVHVPTLLAVITNAIWVSAGGNNSAAVLSGGTAYTWGANSQGQCGRSTDPTIPGVVAGVGGTGTLTGVARVACGNFHTLFLVTGGALYACGKNANGQIGDNTTTQRNNVVPVLGVGGAGTLSGIAAISGGSGHSLALGSNGLVYAWGKNANGQLGDNTTTDRHTPVQVSGLTNVIAIEAGGEHSLALKSDGTLWAWGRNTHGQLGINSTTDSPVPVQVQGVGGTGYLTGVAAMSGGSTHSAAALDDGSCYAWGGNFSGEVGDNTTTERTAPVQVLGVGGTGVLEGITTVSCADSSTFAVGSDGTLYAWGYNGAYDLGDNTTIDRHTPVIVGPVAGITQVFGGNDHGIVLGNTSMIEETHLASGDVLLANEDADGNLPEVIDEVAAIQASNAQGVFVESVKENVARLTMADASATQKGVVRSDPDGTLSANSDGFVASQKAVKTYVDAAILAAVGGTIVDEEIPPEIPDGFIEDYTLLHAPIAGSLKVYVNGRRLRVGVAYTVSGTTVTFLAGPPSYIPQAGDIVVFEYRYL